MEKDDDGIVHGLFDLTVRASGDPLALTPQVEAVVSGLNPDQPIYWVRTLEEGIARTIEWTRSQPPSTTDAARVQL